MLPQKKFNLFQQIQFKLWDLVAERKRGGVSVTHFE